MKKKSLAYLGLVVVLSAGSSVLGQAPGRGGDRGGPGGRFDPRQMQERFLGRIQETLEVTDGEWNAIKPLVQDVFEKQRAGMMGGRRFGRRGRPGDENAFPEMKALEDELAKETPSAESLKAKLTAFRAAREAKTKELQDAREKLRAVLTTKQEAQLVLMGILD